MDLSGGDLSSVGLSVIASDGLISYYPQLSEFGEFRNGEKPCVPPYLSMLNILEAFHSQNSNSLE